MGYTSDFMRQLPTTNTSPCGAPISFIFSTPAKGEAFSLSLLNCKESSIFLIDVEHVRFCLCLFTNKGWVLRISLGWPEAEATCLK